ncbi:hypothetical protein ES708_31670 [subsurface metagenome]
MADQDNKLDLEDVGAGSEDVAAEGKKTGFLPAIVIQTLKWAAIALGFIILGATTTVITFNLINKGRSGSSLEQFSPDYKATEDPLQYDDSIESIRGVTSDEAPAIYTVKVSIGFKQGDNKTAFEFNARRREIQNLIFLILSRKKKVDLKPDKYASLQNELKIAINRIMQSGKIKSVVFREFVVAQ